MVVVGVSPVRGAWRQFQRRQVTPASSHQTTSPGLRVLDDGLAVRGRLEASRCRRRARSRGGPAYRVRSSPPSGIWWRHGDGVVDVGQPVDPRQPLGGAAQQGLGAVAGPLRLGAEGPVRLAPRGDVRQVLDRATPASAAAAAASAAGEQLLGVALGGRGTRARRRRAGARGSRGAARRRRRRRSRRRGRPAGPWWSPRPSLCPGCAGAACTGRRGAGSWMACGGAGAGRRVPH